MCVQLWDYWTQWTFDVSICQNCHVLAKISIIINEQSFIILVAVLIWRLIDSSNWTSNHTRVEHFEIDFSWIYSIAWCRAAKRLINKFIHTGHVHWMPELRFRQWDRNDIISEDSHQVLSTQWAFYCVIHIAWRRQEPRSSCSLSPDMTVCLGTVIAYWIELK